MIDEITLAKVICRAFVEKSVEGFRIGGDVTKSTEPAVRVMMEKDIAKHWQKFLPEARAVLRTIEG